MASFPHKRSFSQYWPFLFCELLRKTPASLYASSVMEANRIDELCRRAMTVLPFMLLASPRLIILSLCCGRVFP